LHNRRGGGGGVAEIVCRKMRERKIGSYGK
jgi:hypothetical protein